MGSGKKIFFSVLILAVIVKLGFTSDPSSSTPEFVATYENSVVLYATSWCGYCKKTRELLANNGIEYIEYDIEHSSRGKKEYDQLGGRGVPLLLIGGQTVRGYDPNTILKLAKNL